MIIVEIISLIASIGTCVLAFLLWKNNSDIDLTDQTDNITSLKEKIHIPKEKLQMPAIPKLPKMDKFSQKENKQSLQQSEQTIEDSSQSPIDIITDIESTEDNVSQVTVDSPDSKMPQKEIYSRPGNSTLASDNYSMEFYIEESIDQIMKSIDSVISKNSFASLKSIFLICAILTLAAAVVLGFLNLWIFFGISLVVASVCVAGFAIKQIKYVKAQGIKRETKDDCAALNDKVLMLNANEKVSEEDKQKTVDRWLNNISEKTKEDLKSINGSAIMTGIVAGIITLLVVGIPFMLPLLINADSELSINDTSESTTVSEPSDVTESVEESTASSITETTPTPTPTPPPVVIVTNPVDLGYLVTDITASSIDNESSGNNYYPEQIMDLNLNTTWAEGVDGNGVGEYVELSIPEGTVISGLVIYTGYCKSSSVFYKNGAPSVIDVYSGDDGYRVDLNSEATQYAAADYDVAVEGICITFPSAIISNGKLRITIVDVRDGESWDDTNISEIILMGAASTEEAEYSSEAEDSVLYEIGYSGTENLITPGLALTKEQAIQSFENYFDANLDWGDDYIAYNTTLEYSEIDSNDTTCVYIQTTYAGAQSYDITYYYMDLYTGSVYSTLYWYVPEDSAAGDPGMWPEETTYDVFNGLDYLY